MWWRDGRRSRVIDIKLYIFVCLRAKLGSHGHVLHLTCVEEGVDRKGAGVGEGKRGGEERGRKLKSDGVAGESGLSFPCFPIYYLFFSSLIFGLLNYQ